MRVLSCFQALLNQLEYLHKTLSVNRLLQKFLIHNHSRIEKRLRPQDVIRRLFKTFQSQISLPILISPNTFTDTNVIGSSNRISIRFIMHNLLVKLESCFMIAKTEVTICQCVAQQILQIRDMLCQFILEVDLARTHQHYSLSILFLHQESKPLTQLEELISYLRLDLCQQSTFQVRKCLIEVPLSHADDSTLSYSFAKDLRTAIFGQQFVIEHESFLLPPTFFMQLGFEQAALRHRIWYQSLQLIHELKTLLKQSTFGIYFDLLKVQFLYFIRLVNSLFTNFQKRQSLILTLLLNEDPHFQQHRSSVLWILDQNSIQIIQYLPIIFHFLVYFSPVKKTILTAIFIDCDVLRDSTQRLLDMPHFFITECQHYQQVRPVQSIRLLNMLQILQTFAIVPHIHQRDTQPIVQFEVIAIIVESTSEYLDCLCHPIIFIMLLALEEQLREVTHFYGKASLVGEVGEAAGIPLKFFWMRYLPCRFTHQALFIIRTAIIILMPKDEKGKNRKYKHHQEKTFTPLTPQQIERAEKIARGEKVEDQPQEQVQNQEENAKFQPRKLEQQRNYELPPEDSD